MVNVRYRSAADLGPRLPETPPTPAGEAPPSVVTPPVDPTVWTPALVIVAILLGIFALLLGSAHIGNADVWLTLATGRLIHTGAYQFGVDPFSWASEGTYWANNSWLGSWLFYLATFSGKAGLGTAKAILVTALAGLLVGTRARSSSLLLTMSFTTLALLAASPRFLAQTTLFSYLGIAVLLWILVHDGHLDDRERPAPRFGWFIPLLFLVWSNLDGHYVLGLFVLIATAVCRFVGPGGPGGRGEAKRLALVSAASIAACALNPHLLRNFELPGELSYVLHIGDSGRALRILQANEPTTFGLMSSLSTDYLSLPNFGWNIAGMAFYLLFLFNLSSFFAVAATSVRTPGLLPRAVIAGGLAALAVLQWTFIPFFALVAGPIAVLNLADRARRPAPTPAAAPAPTWTDAIGKWAAVEAMAALLFLIFLAWPGWLHMGFGEIGMSRAFQAGRRVNWDLEPEPSLHMAALALEAQTKNGEALRVFQPAPELPAYCAYFAPSVKCGIDRRYGLFRDIAADYAKVRDDLVDYAPGDREVLDKFRDWKIDHVALTNYR
ncbi:MAG TPA: hypothetical protein VHR72_14195, partial [Gemmataceae bacterium]|nr:hypothetical protein [Gemmataceae bacterium]